MTDNKGIYRIYVDVVELLNLVYTIANSLFSMFHSSRCMFQEETQLMKGQVDGLYNFVSNENVTVQTTNCYIHINCHKFKLF